MLQFHFNQKISKFRRDIHEVLSSDSFACRLWCMTPSFLSDLFGGLWSRASLVSQMPQDCQSENSNLQQQNDIHGAAWLPQSWHTRVAQCAALHLDVEHPEALRTLYSPTYPKVIAQSRGDLDPWCLKDVFWPHNWHLPHHYINLGIIPLTFPDLFHAHGSCTWTFAF